MRARKRLDISWSDIGFGLANCLLGSNRESAQTELEKAWSGNSSTLAALSVRSGFDLTLQSLALARGSEILVSAINIRDMISIIEHHGLVAVPIDVDFESCAMQTEQLLNAIGANTKAILVAHLFGSRMPMDEIIRIAQRYDLHVFEDCAQAFAADGYMGHIGSDVAMFSFGPIKTATALGGALLVFRDPELAKASRSLQQNYPVQSKPQFLGRVLKYAAIKAITRPIPYTVFFWLCRLMGVSHDRIISNAVRGFAPGELHIKIRHQPSYPLMALMKRRIQGYTAADLAQRIQAASYAQTLLHGITIVAANAESRTYWLLPIMSKRPDQLVQWLWDAGFDATRGATSMLALPATGIHKNACNAQAMMETIVYLPVETAAGAAELRSLAKAVQTFENGISG